MGFFFWSEISVSEKFRDSIYKLDENKIIWNIHSTSHVNFNSTFKVNYDNFYTWRGISESDWLYFRVPGEKGQGNIRDFEPLPPRIAKKLACNIMGSPSVWQLDFPFSFFNSTPLTWLLHFDPQKKLCGRVHKQEPYLGGIYYIISW